MERAHSTLKTSNSGAYKANRETDFNLLPACEF